MSTDVSTTNLQINVLTKKQYNGITPNNEELYFVEDERNVLLLEVSDVEPKSASNGDRYYSSTDKKIYTFNNGWVDGETPDKDILYVSLENLYSYVWNGNEMISIGGFSGYDNRSITLNDEGKIQASATINQNDNSLKFDWIGTRAEYDALTEYHDNWLYYIKDDEPSENMSLSNVLNRLNKAYAWNNIVGDVETIVFTVPLPEVGYEIYSNMDMKYFGNVEELGETSIKCNSIVYSRAEQFDDIFNGVSNDSKKQIVTMYDLITAFKGI
jgi:hypothetical protein